MRKPEEAMKNMKNMKNPQSGALSCLLQVIQVFHVIHVFQVFPMRACVTGDGHAGVGSLPEICGSSRSLEPCGSCRRAIGLFRDSLKGAMA